MSIAQDIIRRRMPDFAYYIAQGNSLDDLDEYGFTPLIECAITRQVDIAERLLEYPVLINKTDVSGRGPLHWAVYNNDLALSELLLMHGANPNAYTKAGLNILVYPVLRAQESLKQLLYRHGAKLDFALDFIQAKLIGHRFELQGDVDIVNAKGEFIELDYEGFILEFTVAIVKDSLSRFISSFSTRHLRDHFPLLHTIIDALTLSSELLQLQHQPLLTEAHHQRIEAILKSPLLILPAASRGHALCFVRFHQWWAKIDRGENSLHEGTVNIYKLTHTENLTVSFIKEFLFQKQNRRYFHQVINQQLGLIPMAQMPITAQITGNCSWANVQAIMPVAYALQILYQTEEFQDTEAITLFEEWVDWDQDRALDECIQRFYIVNPARKASYAAMLGGILFQACDHANNHHIKRAEKILSILSLPEYYYILQSYLDIYCVKRLSKKGNNLLKLLDDCGLNPNIGVSPVATRLKKRR
jgi:Ankyrin repeats (3 copies)